MHDIGTWFQRIAQDGGTSFQRTAHCNARPYGRVTPLLIWIYINLISNGLSFKFKAIAQDKNLFEDPEPAIHSKGGWIQRWVASWILGLRASPNSSKSCRLIMNLRLGTPNVLLYVNWNKQVRHSEPMLICGSTQDTGDSLWLMNNTIIFYWVYHVIIQIEAFY